MAHIHLLNGISFEISSPHPREVAEEINSNHQFDELVASAKYANLKLAVVLNTDENAVCVILGVNIAPTYQSIFRGRTIVGKPHDHPLPDEFESLRNKLESYLKDHYEITYTDVGVVLSQWK